MTRSQTHREKHMSYQHPPYLQLGKSSSRFIPLHKRISPADARNDRNQCFKCNRSNWNPSQKCKDIKFYLCEKNNNDNNKEEEVGDTSLLLTQKLTMRNLAIKSPFQHSLSS